LSARGDLFARQACDKVRYAITESEKCEPDQVMLCGELSRHLALKKTCIKCHETKNMRLMN